MINNRELSIFKIILTELIASSILIILSVVFKSKYIYTLVNIMFFIVLFTAAITDIIEMHIYDLTLINLLLIKLFKIYIEKIRLNLFAVLLILILYIIVYLVSKKSIGTGDIYLSTILAIGMNITESFRFFSVTFIFGAIYAVYLIILKRASSKTALPLIPFIIIAYIFMKLKFGGL